MSGQLLGGEETVPADVIAWAVMERGKIIATSQHKRAADDWMQYGEGRTLVPLIAAMPAAPAKATQAEPILQLRRAFVTYMSCPTVRNYDALLDTLPNVIDWADGRTAP